LIIEIFHCSILNNLKEKVLKLFNLIAPIKQLIAILTAASWNDFFLDFDKLTPILVKSSLSHIVDDFDFNITTKHQIV